jgi:hypothetical protein
MASAVHRVKDGASSAAGIDVTNRPSVGGIDEINAEQIERARVFGHTPYRRDTAAGSC